MTKYIAIVAISFLIGVVYTDYHYREIPREIIVSVPTRKDIELNNKLQICKGQSDALVLVDGSMVNAAFELVDDYTARLRLKHINADQDRYDDIYKMMKRRDPITEIISSL